MQRQTQGVKYKCIESNENGNVVTPRTKTRRAAQVPFRISFCQVVLIPGSPLLCLLGLHLLVSAL
jgi:hypothetical protein